ncbi:hypothetical protein BKN38_00265 [Helicobacter sp. CLO-3]|uniref:hypothetical protein n=1 Tax=unclassified Helicobacter TaxID=2593540 RepID=UPI000805537E|nr:MULTISPECIES: hypothetical protein [unclassified Helicobacter]OBV30026.1 hypothetical protein BA723_03125 [Helicobacter sp. CLO-3]OHU85873.1 hypothetical protein BKN38_00265 [Helicobacter sp. CLO-3]
MKKALLWIGSFCTSFLLCALLLIFTSIGNKILSTFLQSAINKAYNAQSQISDLRIGLGKLQASLKLAQSLNLDIQGVYNFKGFDINASLSIDKAALDAAKSARDSSRDFSKNTDETIFIGSYRLHGSYDSYTITPTKLATQTPSSTSQGSRDFLQASPQAPLQTLSQALSQTLWQDFGAPSFALIAEGGYLTLNAYKVESSNIPLNLIARFLRLSIAPQGVANIIADKRALESSTQNAPKTAQNLAIKTQGAPINFDIKYQQITAGKVAESRNMLGVVELDSTQGVLSNQSSARQPNQKLATNQNASSQILPNQILPKQILLQGSAQNDAPFYILLGVKTQNLAGEPTTAHFGRLAIEGDMSAKRIAYMLDIQDLEAFGRVFGLEFVGSMLLSGTIEDNDGLKISAQSESFGGVARVSMEGETISFGGEDLSLTQILGALQMPRIADARVNLQGIYNLAFHKGSLTAQSPSVSLMLDSENLGLEGFVAHEWAQDTWGVGADTSAPLAQAQLEGSIDGARIDAQITLKSATQTLQSSACRIDLSAQTLDLRLLEPAIRISGKFSDLSTRQEGQDTGTQNIDLQNIDLYGVDLGTDLPNEDLSGTDSW